MNYEQYIQDDLDRTVRRITDKFSGTDDWSEVDLAAACHLYVGTNVEYEKRDKNPRRAFRSPREVLDDHAGNCQEQTILLVSLFNSVPTTEVRIVWPRMENEVIYMLPEIKFFTNRTGYMGLYNFYKKAEFFSGSATSFSQDNFGTEEEEKAYYIADPSSGDYIGDNSWMVENGFIATDNDSSNKWEYVDEPVFKKIKSSWMD